MDGEHPNDPLHGVTLEAMLLALVEKYGWEGLAERIPVRCFESDPSLKSSLTFLRRTPWARAKVEALYLGKLRPRRPARRRPGTGAEGRAADGGPKAKPAATPAAGQADRGKRRDPAAGPAGGSAPAQRSGSAATQRRDSAAAQRSGSDRAPEAGPAASGSEPAAKPAPSGRNRYPGLFED